MCIVKAVKQLIEANISTDQRSRAIAGQSENNARKALTYCQKIEKDLLKKEADLKLLVEKSEKLVQQSLAMKAHDLEMSIRSNTMKLADLTKDVSKTNHEFASRLSTFMNGEEVSKFINYQVEEQLGVIRREFKEDFFKLNVEVQAISKSLQLPGLTGANSRYQSITDFLVIQFRDNNYLFDQIQKQLNKLEEETIRSLRQDTEANRRLIGKTDEALGNGLKELKGLVASESHKLHEDAMAKYESLRQEQRILDSKIKDCRKSIGELGDGQQNQAGIIDEIKTTLKGV